ncbi:pyridoxamine 5'-phosphate oxidase [Actinocatenispora rupis]|uniref:Pyridoxine/pyridoxamine 5'-phosphate oxidase n=1 Tax=Actinocatenispora rupis TaxID=519421 RepID=A0A8J3J383_9ACTN|nr:pyridoxine/pyridoxamine 5'-phosphate oxidase [Actinocatenispora rupis]
MPETPSPLDPTLVALMRNEYATTGIAPGDLAADWYTQLGRWLADATAAGLPEPNAMVLATADAAGRPASRTVLLKGYDAAGLVFFTNYRSAKGTQLTANPYASVTFPWYGLHRQAHAAGRVAPVPADESDAYFASRPRGAQLGAWSSPQSTVITGRDVLDDSFAAYAERWPEGTPVPRPPHWGGFRLVPETVEFWQGRENRVHDRLRYRRDGGSWVLERLAP